MAFNSKMHERNIYKNRPDFAQISKDYPLFRKYAYPDAKGKYHVDFSNTEALRMLTTILLKKDFQLDVEIPLGYLIPTVPQRLNYILWIEDLLADILDTQENAFGIDIGTGPCAIFALLGAKKNSWNFIATESSEKALDWAKKNVEKNNLSSKIEIVKVSSGSTLQEVLSANEKNYDFCLCNPPFYDVPEEIRKKHPTSEETLADVAQQGEIFFKGGEVEFVKNMIKDSLAFKKRIRLFTSMFGKKISYQQILKELNGIEGLKLTTTEFCQGNTVRWGIAWTFDDSVEFPQVQKKEKPKKAKPPLEFPFPIANEQSFKMEHFSEKVQRILNEFEISVTLVKSTPTYVELQLKADKCTWANQRRKRRELERQKKLQGCSTTHDSNLNNIDSTGETNAATSKDEADQIVCDASTNPDNVESSKPISKESNPDEPEMQSEGKDLNASDLELCSTEETVTRNKSETSDPRDSSINCDIASNEKKRKLDLDYEESVKAKKLKPNEMLVQGFLLNCKLQLIKGRKKVYVKMNCTPSEDRNVMHQFFLVFKNKLTQ